MAVLCVLGLGGCSASLSMTEHKAAQDALKLEYEARLAAHRRQVEEALEQAAQCQRGRELQTEITTRRVAQLERSLASKQVGGRGPRAPKAKAEASGGRVGALSAAMPKGAGIQPEGDTITVVLPSQVLFAEGAFTVHEAGRRALTALAQALSGQAQRVTVAAFTDPLLASDAAWTLSAAQAQAVVIGLQSAGLDPSRLVLQAQAGFAPRPGVPAQRIELVVRGSGPASP